MSLKAKIAIYMAIFFWASAFVGIRAGLKEFGPESLALLRYLVASLCMGLIYFKSPHSIMRKRDVFALLCLGAIGIGVYNVTLNHGEIAIPSGMASFFISQAPIVTAILAMILLGEKSNFTRIIGFSLSIIGVGLITIGTKGGFVFDKSLAYILIAVLASGCYSLLQKPFLKKYHAIETTTVVILGGTLFLLLYSPLLWQDLHHVSWFSIGIVVYLGIFPGALGYIGWSIALAEIPASRAMSFLYFTPFIATLLGWACLGEVPGIMSILGGLVAVMGVSVVNYSYRGEKKLVLKI